MIKQDYLTKKSPLKNEPADIRYFVEELAYSLCGAFCIPRDKRTLSLELGVFSDKNNLEAVSTWVYYELQTVSTDRAGEVIKVLKPKLEKELNLLDYSDIAELH